MNFLHLRLKFDHIGASYNLAVELNLIPEESYAVLFLGGIMRIEQSRTRKFTNKRFGCFKRRCSIQKCFLIISFLT